MAFASRRARRPAPASGQRQSTWNRSRRRASQSLRRGRGRPHALRNGRKRSSSGLWSTGSVRPAPVQSRRCDAAAPRVAIEQIERARAGHRAAGIPPRASPCSTTLDRLPAARSKIVRGSSGDRDPFVHRRPRRPAASRMAANRASTSVRLARHRDVDRTAALGPEYPRAPPPTDGSGPRLACRRAPPPSTAPAARSTDARPRRPRVPPHAAGPIATRCSTASLAQPESTELPPSHNPVLLVRRAATTSELQSGRVRLSPHISRG